MAIVINPLENAIQLLQDFGFFSVILPMILVFAVFYGILEQTKIFGDKDTQYVNAVIAFVAAFLVVASTDIVRVINEFIPHAAFLLIIVMLLLMTFTFFGFSPRDFMGKPNKWTWIFVIILVIIFLGILDASAGWEVPIIHDLSQSFTGEGGGAGTGGGGGDDLDEAVGLALSLAILVGIPLLIMYFITRR